MKKGMSVFKICFIALAVCINLIGGQLALMLRLPIYLDSIGTMLVGALCGPVYGMIPNLLSGVIFGMTTDVYSLYYAPVGMLVGWMCGLAWKKKKDAKFWIFWAALFITVPGTIVSSLITAVLFGGITSSGSTILVQLLAKTPLGLTGSVFAVQIVTDYVDRLLGLLVVLYLMRALPEKMIRQIKEQ